MNHASLNGYEIFDELIAQLRTEGHYNTAQRLQVLLREVAWTTGSELIGEFGREILAFQSVTQRATPELQRLLRGCMDEVRRVWPDIK
jgi:hypothetical protein